MEGEKYGMDRMRPQIKIDGEIGYIMNLYIPLADGRTSV
jgi:hypothetical protein